MNKKKVIKQLSLIAGLTTADLLSKAWADRFLSIYDKKPVIPGFFDLWLAENTGISYSLLARLPSSLAPWLIYLPSFVIILFVFFRLRRFNQLGLRPAGLLMFLSGALGNLLNRLANGKVTDFLYFHVLNTQGYPILNFADLLVGAGTLLWIYQELTHRSKLRNI
ncbi:MAG: signal peptidase II [Cytophagales bacterium]|nr:signal peptidase II [Cytophagales bacterium]